MAAHKRNFEFHLLGKRYFEDSRIGALRRLIRELSRRDDGFVEKLARIKFRKNRIISEDPLQLNPDRRLAEKFSERFSGRWWLYNNLSEKQIAACMAQACLVAGLNYGSDFRFGGMWEHHKEPINILIADITLEDLGL